MNEWKELTTGAWCYYDNDPSKGKLYNWYAVVGIHDAFVVNSRPKKRIFTRGLAGLTYHREEWFTLQENLILRGYNYDGTTTGNKIAKAMASTTG